MANNENTTITSYNGSLVYVGGAVQVNKEVDKSQPGEYETFISQKVIKEADYLHNPYLMGNALEFAGLSNATRVHIVNGDKATMANGVGVCRDRGTNQILYNGEWRLGYRHGYGEATLFGEYGALLGQYKGMFRFNHRHGYGELTYPDGTVWRGEWKCDRKNGPGVETDLSGGSFAGIWRNGRKVGSLKYTFPDKSVSWFFYTEDGVWRHASPVTSEPSVDIAALVTQMRDHARFDQQSKNTVQELAPSVPMGSEKPPAPGPLNLTLKKGLGEFKEVSLPNLNTKLKSVWKDMSIEVDVDSFTAMDPPAVPVWTLYVYNSGFVVAPVVETLAALAKDSFYGNELGGIVKKILIRCVPKLHQLSVKVDGSGLLTIEGSFDLGDESRITVENLKQTLVKTL
jgi:hypothetical protein